MSDLRTATLQGCPVDDRSAALQGGDTGSAALQGGQYVARSTRVAARMVGDEMMIMSGRDSTLFVLNGTAALLWDAADGVTPLDEIVAQKICTQFDVEPSVALRDAADVVNRLAGHGLLRVSNTPLAAGA